MSIAVFIAGGDKNAGKTTLSLGLVSYFNEHFKGSAAFIKPLGQKTSALKGAKVGQDSYLISQALQLGIPLNYSAPFATSDGIAEQYIRTGEPVDMIRKVRKAFKYLSNKYEIVIVEGTGHPGVGSVFNMSNATVASQFQVPVILVLDGGIGSTIDKFNLCRAMFDNMKVRIIGVVINKVLPTKIEKIKGILDPWFLERGYQVFGYIPYRSSFTLPSLGVLKKELEAVDLYFNPEGENRSVDGYITAFGSVKEVLKSIEDNPKSVLVLSASRQDVIDAVIARKLSGSLTGDILAMILCGGSQIDKWVVKSCRKSDLPLFQSLQPVEKTAFRLNKKVFKVEPEEHFKIGEIVKLVKKHVDMDAILQHLQEDSTMEKKARGIITRALRVPMKFFGRIIGKNG